MQSIRELNQEKLEQISSLNTLLKSSYGFGKDEVDGKIEEYHFPLSESGWDPLEIRTIKDKILKLISELK